MELKILSWNVWGLNDLSKRRIISAVIRRQKPHVICLQETKMESVEKAVVDSVGGNKWVDWDYIGAIGAARGVLVMWDSRTFSLLGTFKGSFSVSCLFKGVEKNITWVFSGIYGPCLDASRVVLWDELKLVRQKWNFSWCVGGDLKVIRFPHERFGLRVFSETMIEFNDFINAEALVDLPLAGSTFTWFRGGDRINVQGLIGSFSHQIGRSIFMGLFRLVFLELFPITLPFCLSVVIL